MVDSGANFNGQRNTNNVNQPQLQPQSFNLNSININNIFQQSGLLLPNTGAPIQPEEPKKIPAPNAQVNEQESQKLNSFLNSLGFKIGNPPPEAIPQQPGVLQPLELIARAKDGIYLVNDQEKDYLNDKSKLICESAVASIFSRDGTMIAFASQTLLGVYLFKERKRMTFDLPNIVALDFSPKQRFLTTIDRRENRFFITIFESDPLRKLFEFETVRYKKETWPQLKFTENDELAFWASKPTQIEVLNPRRNFQNLRTIETRPFDFFIISEKIENLMVVCVSLEHSAGYNGHEGRVDVYRYQDLETQTTPLVSKIIDKAHEVNLFFSPSGQNLLIWAQNFADKTGQSYYGEHTLFYLDINKKTLKRVPTYKGPIHDVAWNPNGLEFIAISGFMPAGSVLYDNLCTPKFEFGRHHRNTIKWSPLSRFVSLCGFGNLPGDMEIWDVYSLKQVGTCKSQAAVTCRWAPDGRRIITGTLNPRLRVSNNYKVFKYNGELLNFVDFSSSELYEVLYKPAKFQDRPASPPKKIEGEKLGERSESEKSEKSDRSEGEENKKVFRPKIGGAFAAQLKAEKNARTGGRFLEPGEIFGNEANLEDYVEKKEEDGEKEKKEEEPTKKMVKITRRTEKKPEEENKDGEYKPGEGEQKKEAE